MAQTLRSFLESCDNLNQAEKDAVLNRLKQSINDLEKKDELSQGQIIDEDKWSEGFEIEDCEDVATLIEEYIDWEETKRFGEGERFWFNIHTKLMYNHES